MPHDATSPALLESGQTATSNTVCPQVAVSQGGWRTTSVLKLLVNVNMSKLKVTCSAVNKLYRNTVEDTKTIRILSESAHDAFIKTDASMKTLLFITIQRAKSLT